MIINDYIQKVIFVDEDFLKELEKDSITKYQKFQCPEVDIKIIKLPLNDDERGEVFKCIHPSKVRVGNFLAKPSYSRHFVSIDQFTEDNAISKYRLWVELCLALGAKKVCITNIENVSLEAESDSALSVGISGSHPVASAEASLAVSKTSRDDEIKKKIMKFSASAAGGEPDIDAAQQIINEHNLSDDDMFMSVFRMRKLRMNPVLTHEFELDFSNDIKNVFDSSMKAKLDVMSKFYSGSLDFENQKNTFNNTNTAIKLSVAVDF